MVINISIYTAKSFVSVTVNIHTSISISNSSIRKHKIVFIIFKHACSNDMHTHTLFVYSVWEKCYLTFDLYSVHMIFTLGLHKDHFSVKINSISHYEFKKCSSNACKGDEIHATRPQMYRLAFIFSSSFNLLSGRGVN